MAAVAILLGYNSAPSNRSCISNCESHYRVEPSVAHILDLAGRAGLKRDVAVSLNRDCETAFSIRWNPAGERISDNAVVARRRQHILAPESCVVGVRSGN